ncbi:flavodoxin family protein [Alkaliphilus peptidifermentans]|uniref:NADPH-dependent FMN reductase n=1 Tax=Alkaliphilus peptidifermentans DSM 18978 TaxID=1120976 RepID=A0A1G5LDU2_9FIRM|nr:flavodoxin family protein [Alkaliphilus peptidifermentans]SCZ10468.1 NADPH-dependent FMN reductase [Alkaliphilus peptidifermentans DSM 18978]
MLKILAIMGSPRKGKNNEVLLDNMLQGIQDVSQLIEIEKIYAADVGAVPCSACDACTKRLGCIKNDSINDIFEKYNSADIIILTSPIYFNSISAQLKALIDRNQAIWSSKYALKKSLINRDKKRFGYVICTAGAVDQPFGLSAVVPIMDLFFKSINTEYIGNLFVTNLDEVPVYLNEEKLKEARTAGKKLMEEYNASF